MLIVAQTSPLEIRWTVPDHLGTPRMNIRGTGTDGGSLASVARHDYLPFGEELFAGVGLRSGSHGYELPSDGVRQKFTGYERDSETSLDFVQARYYSSVQGRFTSVDPIFLAPKRLFDPQQINLYAYCKNQPLKFIDPDGKYFVGTDGKRVDASIKDGKVTLSDNASEDLKRMTDLIVKSGSKTALSIFEKLANNETKLNFKIETAKKIMGYLVHMTHTTKMAKL